jgi:hypothetical protein
VKRVLPLIAATLLAGCFVSGCKRENRPGLAPPPVNIVPDAKPKEGSVVTVKEIWQRAMNAPDDPLELTRLAVAEGATGLMAGLEEGGASSVVALAALPFAEDADLAMGRLGEILLQADEKSAPLVIASITGIVQRPLRSTELLDPLGAHAAFDALVVVAKNEKLPADVRAQAVSAGRLIAARRPYDARLLPTDFDK